MDEACSSKILVRKHEETNHFQELGVDGRIILP
jgi:hypothetical protein